MEMQTKIGRWLLRPFLGKRQFQAMFETLHKVSLAGMNLGEGGMPDQSGEEWLLGFIHSELTRTTNVPIVFDVGANVGQFAQSVHGAFRGNLKLWSFEPCHASFVELQRNLGGHAGVTLVNAAMGSTEGHVEMHSPATGSKLASIYSRLPFSEAGGELSTEKAVCQTIDSFVAANGVDCIDFLKIDVEGHELEVLRGARKLLESDAINFIQFEFSAAHVDARVFFRDFYLLLNPRFGLYRVLQNGLRPIKKYSPEMEVFRRATNYLAIRKAREA